MNGNVNGNDQLRFVNMPPQPAQQPQAPKKKSKVGIILIFLIVVAGVAAGFFLIKNNKKPSEPPASNTNQEEENSNNNNSLNQVKSDKFSLVAENITILNHYGKYFEIENDGKYTVIDEDGKTVLENPLYLSSAVSDGKVVYQGKPLAVSGTFDKYKVYYSTDAKELGYVVVFNAILELQSNKVQNYYIGNDTMISIYWNQQTEENFIVKYNIKTGAVLTESIIDGYLDFFEWNGNSYLAESHNNIVELDTLKKVFKKEYTLGDGPYLDDHSKVISASNRYLTAAINGKYGIIDASENEIIPFQYVSLKQVNDSIIIAQTKDGYGIIDYKNQKKLDFAYEQIDIYSNCIVAIDHNGILKVLNNQFEPLFTGSRKVNLKQENASYKAESIREKWNVLSYYNMTEDLEDTSYFVIVDSGSGKSKELTDYQQYEKVNRSPSGYGYVVFMSKDDFSVYDGIVEIAKANISEFGFTSATGFYYVGNDYIAFKATKEGEKEPKQYFLNMKKNIIEELKNTNLKEDEIITYDELFDKGHFLKYENGRINIYDTNNNLLCSIIGDSIKKLDGTEKYYEIKNHNKVTIIRLNEK